MKSLVDGAVDDCPGGRTGVLAGVVVAAMGDCVGGRTGDLAGVDVVVVVVVVSDTSTPESLDSSLLLVVVVGPVVDAIVSPFVGAVCFGVDVVGFEVDATAGGVCGGVDGMSKRFALASRASLSFLSLSSFALLSSSPCSDRLPLP